MSEAASEANATRRVRARVGPRLLALSLLALAVTPSVAETPLRPSSQAPTGSTGCLAVHGSRVLEQHRADERHAPASVQKLAVTAVALEKLGPDFRVRTRLEALASVENGVLDGDLVVRAAGDPTWSRRFFDEGASSPLARLAASVRRSGVERVRGDLIVDLSRFPGRPAAASRAINEVAFGYAAPTGGLAVDENVVMLRMAPGRRVGEKPSFESMGNPAAELEISNLATTVPATRHEKGTVDFQVRWDDGRLAIRGEYPISEPAYEIEIAVADGERRASRRLLAALRGAGVTLEGEIRIVSSPPGPGRLVAELASPPLAEWLPPILGESQNWLTEMLLRILAAELLGEGRDEDGLELLEKILRQEVGVAEGAAALDDASGVSPYNLWTPRAVVRLLEWSWQRPWRELYAGALARPGRGTLKYWPALPATLVAKTGTGRQALGLAGFLLNEGPESEPVIFACLLDRRVEERATLRGEIATRAWRWHRLATQEQAVDE